MIKVKAGVKPKNLVIMAACANAAQDMKITVTITAGVDGKHMTASKHYTYEALDVRSKDFESLTDKAIFMENVLKRLGKGYQGFLEGKGTDNEHFHFEYDPR